jgi:diaminopimelate decarboxylase
MDPLPWSLLPDSARQGPDGDLWIGGCSTVDLAEAFGTPLFVYDQAHLRSRLAEARRLFGAGAVYAAKAFFPLAMARLVDVEGLRVDVATGGEMFVALRAGIPGSRLVVHGNNKSRDELEEAAAAGAGRLVVDSFDELDRIERLHQDRGHVFDVLIRVTPGVEAHTHHYIATGQDDTKFGFTLSTGAASAAVARVRTMQGARLRGIHLHIGSQVFLVDSFAAALGVVAPFLRDHGLEELSMGGGLGVAYVSGETAPSLADWAAMLGTAAEDAGLEAALMVEPGRAIAAAAAVTIYTVGTIKELPGIRTYVAVDGGMSDNPRPVLYGSGYETFLPRAVTAPRPRPIRLVGKHCESGDVLVGQGWVPEDLMVGDLIATPVTGAYGHAMGSNYNRVPRPAVVFVEEGEPRLVVRRETYEDLVRNEL